MDWPIGGCCACVVRLSGHAPATWKHVNRAIRRIRRVIHEPVRLATFDVLILELPSVDEDARRIGVAVNGLTGAAPVGATGGSNGFDIMWTAPRVRVR